MTQTVAAERVSRGIRLLSDEQIDSIDLELLDISSPTRCILGQLFGNFSSDESWAFLDEHDLTRYKRNNEPTVVSHGFDRWTFNDGRCTADDLTTEWVRQITAHREARVSA